MTSAREKARAAFYNWGVDPGLVPPWEELTDDEKERVLPEERFDAAITAFIGDGGGYEELLERWREIAPIFYGHSSEDRDTLHEMADAIERLLAECQQFSRHQSYALNSRDQWKERAEAAGRKLDIALGCLTDNGKRAYDLALRKTAQEKDSETG